MCNYGCKISIINILEKNLRELFLLTMWYSKEFLICSYSNRVFYQDYSSTVSYIKGNCNNKY